MHIIRVDEHIISAGRAVFNAYLARTLCGPGSTAYEFYSERVGGARAVIGSILECINHGLINEDDIVHAVSRATRCRATTVESFLNFFAGDDPEINLWRLAGSHYQPLDRSTVRSQTVLAA